MKSRRASKPPSARRFAWHEGRGGGTLNHASINERSPDASRLYLLPSDAHMDGVLEVGSEFFREEREVGQDPSFGRREIS